MLNDWIRFERITLPAGLRADRAVVVTALTGVAAAFWVSAAGLARAAEPLPVADFFRPPAFASMVMSPGGQSIAATAAGQGGRVGLVILDLRDLFRSKNIASFSDADVNSVQWVNDDRLVFDLTDRRLAYGDQKGSGLLTTDRAGKEPMRLLIKREKHWITESGTRIADHSLSIFHWLHTVVRDASSDVIVQRLNYSNAREPQGTQLLRLDTRTGLTANLALGEPEHVFSYGLDAHGLPRALVTRWAGKQVLYWKAAQDQPWASIREYEAYGDTGTAPGLMYVDANDTLYATAGTSAGTSALMQFDMRSGKLNGKTLLALAGYDFSGSLVRNGKGAVLGVRYLTDARATHWFDPGMAQIQKQVDALLPGSINRLDCGNCESPTRVLVISSSDRQPNVFRLFDVPAGTLEEVAASRPWIKPAAMAMRDMVRITARDGLSLPVHVTRPLGNPAAAPMVVLVHGGPYLRGGEWRWDADSQFLASRGYVVIEPEFRGSTGFGRQLFRAGFKQWGLAMQDDIADATLWAIKQGYADAKRVCIAGASYGGYATLMGLIRYPEIYRCGVEWVGVTDIDLMYSSDWSDATEQWKDHGMPAMIGDRVKDAAQLAATSPLKLAARLTQPLLMAYGGADRRVPIEHGKKLRDALLPHNKNVEWIEYPAEGHGWMLEANHVDFWTRVEKFLDRNLKNAP